LRLADVEFGTIDTEQKKREYAVAAAKRNSSRGCQSPDFGAPSPGILSLFAQTP